MAIDAEFLNVTAIADRTVAMLLTFFPTPGVATAVSIHVNTVSVPPVQLVEAFIAAAIRILLLPEAVDFLINPRALELFTVRPRVGAVALHDTVLVVAGVGLLVGPALDTVPIALAILEVTNEDHTVGIGFFAHARLDTSFPHALVYEEIDVPRYSLTMALIVGPLTLICFALHMSECAVAVRPSKVPGA